MTPFNSRQTGKYPPHPLRSASGVICFSFGEGQGVRTVEQVLERMRLCLQTRYLPFLVICHSRL